jgi:peptidoglycan/LPS O-acetylase OafA/YrhL
VTTAAENPGRRPLHALAMLLGHYITIITPINALIMFAVIVYRAVWAHRMGVVASAIAMAVMSVVFVALLLKDFYHDRRLCLRCLNAAPMLNPQAAVDKHIEALRSCHFRRWRVSSLAVVLIATFIVAVAVPLAGWPWPGRALLIVAGAVGFTAALYMDYATVMHSRLQPWCRWCKRRGFGGEPLPEPTPDPTAKASR